MKRIGIIAEYNPFHEGHRHHIEESRRIVGEESAVIAVMSGDFVQRGEPAIRDKFTRTRAALEGGADLVLELPLHVTLSSAEGFAEGAIQILSSFHVDFLSFGSETGSTERLEEIAALTAKRSFVDAVKQELKQNPDQNFAAARQTVAERELGCALPELHQPNNILGIEYMKALSGTGIRPFAVKRVGAGHDEPGENVYPSASELRRRIRESGGGPDPVLQEALILDRLRCCSREDFADTGLGDSLYREIRRGSSYDEILSAVATRRYPLARVRRVCMRAILNVKDTGTEFIRVLGFNEKGRELLRPGADIPLLTKAAHVWKMSEEAQAQFINTAAAHDFYCLISRHPEAGEDWRRGPEICI